MTKQEAAWERAKRTFTQGVGLDVAIAVAAALLVWLPEADVLDGTAWVILGTAVLKTVLTAIASYVMRLKVSPKTEVRADLAESSHVDVPDAI